MVTEPEYLYIVMMDVEPDKEELFNNTYTYEHIQHVLNVHGVLSATRYEVSTEGMPKYLAIYGLESPDVPASPPFRKAVDLGKWPTEVRPFTKNRSRLICRRMKP